MKLFLKLVGIFFLLIGSAVLLVYLTIKFGLFPNAETSSKKILDTIPIYENAVFDGESKTGFPASPSVIRNYKSLDSRVKIMNFYTVTLRDMGWSLKTHDTNDPYVPGEIVAEKEKWRLSILFYSTGKYSLRLYFN